MGKNEVNILEATVMSKVFSRPSRIYTIGWQILAKHSKTFWGSRGIGVGEKHDVYKREE